MNFEEALVYELSEIAEIRDKVFPLSAPEDSEPPFVIYVSSEGVKVQTLEGFSDLTEVTFEIHVTTIDYSLLKSLTKQVMDKIFSFYSRAIGEAGPFIKSVTIDEPAETKIADVDYNRCAFDCHIRF
jgi:hypothetical protein